MNDAAPVKTPIEFALEQFATAEVRDYVLRVTHAIVSTCLTQAMLETAGKSAETVAAEAKAYASQLQMLEKIMGAGHSSVPLPKQRTQYTTPNRLPQQPTQ